MSFVSFVSAVVLPTAGLLAGMLVCIELGRWSGRRRREVAREGDEAIAVSIDGAVFALLGLFLAFTFSGAMGRFDYRRSQIVDEANAIGTAYLRIDLLPADEQPSLRAQFREYVQARLETYRALPELEEARAQFDRSIALQGEIWTRAISAARSSGDPATLTLVASALNAMFDVSNARLVASRTHVPAPIVALLFCLALAAALVVGYESAADARHGWFRTSLFAVVIAGSIFVIRDLEYPRAGFIHLESADLALEEVLQQMGGAP